MEATIEEMQIEKYPAYKDSGVEWLGEIPEHWEIDRLKNHVDLLTGFHFKCDKYSATGIKLAREKMLRKGIKNGMKPATGQQ